MPYRPDLTRHAALRQANATLRRDDPLLWWVAAFLAVVICPRAAIDLLWLDFLDWLDAIRDRRMPPFW